MRPAGTGLGSVGLASPQEQLQGVHLGDDPDAVRQAVREYYEVGGGGGFARPT